MGQTTVGVMFGAKRPEGLDLYSDDRSEGLLERYERAKRPKGSSWEWQRRTVPAVGGESRDVFGFWVALDRGGRDCGVPEVGTVALSEFASTDPYDAALALAINRWEAFAAWAATQGVAMPEARLWLATTEVA